MSVRVRCQQMLRSLVTSSMIGRMFTDETMSRPSRFRKLLNLSFILQALSVTAFYTITCFWMMHYEGKSYILCLKLTLLLIPLQFLITCIQIRDRRINRNPFVQSGRRTLRYLFCALVCGLLWLFLAVETGLTATLSAEFYPIQGTQLIEIREYSTAPDEAGVKQDQYSWYASLKFNLDSALLVSRAGNQSIFGCGCGESYSPVSYKLRPYQYYVNDYNIDGVKIPAWECMCTSEEECLSLNSTSNKLYYQVVGDPVRALSNQVCPPQSMDFIQIYSKPEPTGDDITIYFYIGFCFVPFMLCLFNFGFTFLDGILLRVTYANPFFSSGGKLWLYFLYMAKIAGVYLVVLVFQWNLIEDLWIMLTLIIIPFVPGFVHLFFFRRYQVVKGFATMETCFVRHFNEAKNRLFVEPFFKEKETIEHLIVIVADTVGRVVNFFIWLILLLASYGLDFFCGVLMNHVIGWLHLGYMTPAVDFESTTFMSHLDIEDRRNFFNNLVLLSEGILFTLPAGIVMIIIMIKRQTADPPIVLACLLFFFYFSSVVASFFRQCRFFKSAMKALASHNPLFHDITTIAINRAVHIQLSNVVASAANNQNQVPNQV